MTGKLQFFNLNWDNQPINSDEKRIWNSRKSLKSFTFQCLLLCLTSLSIYLFNVEAHLGLPILMPLVFVAFIINALLPKLYRLAFFFFASLIPIFYSFGLIEGALLIAVALTMIGICHLPLSLSIRKFGVLALGALLAYAQYTLVKTGWIASFHISSQLISLLGVMFMFRMIIYLYELKFAKEPSSVWHRLSYFFMLPNICFPIFPIVDYKTFKLTYYNQPDLDIYQKGINLIVLGLFQSLCYRVLYYLAPQQLNVTGLWGLVHYLVISYLLLIRLNGMLNIAIGILRLFGFNLPDIFNYMFLARGVDDYWRRLNIYWKDFMLKIFYYPIYFKFRRHSTILALIIGTMVTFFFNWGLHSYQWFWILGKFSMRKTEMIFWSFLCLFVLFAILKQYKNKIVATESNQKEWRNAFTKSSAVFYTFCTMSVIYSLYTSPSINGWVKLLNNVGRGTTAELLILMGIILFLITIGAILFLYSERGKFSHIANMIKANKTVVVIQSLFLGILIILSTPTAESIIKNKSGYSIKTFISHELTTADKNLQSKGYYEELLLSDNFSSPLWQIENAKPKTWENLTQAGLKIEDDLFVSILPNTDALFKAARIQTNRWGLRDKDYEKERPPNIIRIAILGGSLEMGAGVKNEDVFESLVEDRLNENFSKNVDRFEVINFSVSGLSTIRNIEKLRRDVFEFNPNYVLVFVHNEEVLHFQKTLRWISKTQKNPATMEEVRRASRWLIQFENFLHIENIMYDPLSSDKEKNSQGTKIMTWAISFMKSMCSQKHIKMLMVFMPDTNNQKSSYHIFESIAKKESIPLINLSDAYNGHDRKNLRIRNWDDHPNALGHKLIGNQLYLELVKYLELK